MGIEWDLNGNVANVPRIWVEINWGMIHGLTTISLLLWINARGGDDHHHEPRKLPSHEAILPLIWWIGINMKWNMFYDPPIAVRLITPCNTGMLTGLCIWLRSGMLWVGLSENSENMAPKWLFWWERSPAQVPGQWVWVIKPLGKWDAHSTGRVLWEWSYTKWGLHNHINIISVFPMLRYNYNEREQ